MESTDEDWARGYARQALSDLDAREALCGTKVHKCHRLHFLQMAAEKVCKAYSIKTGRHGPVWKSHVCVKEYLPLLARHFYTVIDGGKQKSQRQIASIKHFAGEIDLLAPAYSLEGLRKDNSEYPWEDGKGKICIPCEYSFPNINDEPGSREIISLIKLIRTASEAYSR